MNIRSIVALFGLVISSTVPTFAQQKGTIDPKIEQQIRVLAANYDAASSWIFGVFDARLRSVSHRELEAVLVRYGQE
jgi:hypothetical protein